MERTGYKHGWVPQQLELIIVRSTDSVFMLIKRTLAHKGTGTNRWVPFVLFKGCSIVAQYHTKEG